MQYATFERILDEEEVADDLPDAPAPIDEAYVVDSLRLLSRATLLLTYDVFTTMARGTADLVEMADAVNDALAAVERATAELEP